MPRRKRQNTRGEVGELAAPRTGSTWCRENTKLRLEEVPERDMQQRSDIGWKTVHDWRNTKNNPNSMICLGRMGDCPCVFGALMAMGPMGVLLKGCQPVTWEE